MRRRALALLLLAFALPLGVSFDPPRIGVAPAAACSGMAYLPAVPVATGYPAPPPIETLPINGRALVYTDRSHGTAWAPSETDLFQITVDGRVLTGKPRVIVPGLFAVEPPEAFKGGSTVEVAWKDTTLKPTARYRVGNVADTMPPVITGGTALTAFESRSDCESRFQVKVAMTIADDSPVVVAAWTGPRAEGAPFTFAAFPPGADSVQLGMPGPVPEITLVAFDAAGNRSAAKVARLAGEGTDPPPGTGKPALKERGTRRRAFGCGKRS